MTAREKNLAILTLLTLLVFADMPALAAPRIWLKPNAAWQEGLPLHVTLEAFGAANPIELSIQRDCSAKGFPEKSAACPALWGPRSIAAGSDSHRFEALELKDLPSGVFLWVVAESGGNSATSRFYRGDPCSVFQTLFQSLGGGRCDLHFEQLLRDALRSTGDEQETEVRLLALGGESKPVPGTRGATGVAWAGPASLLVTLAGDEDSRLVRLDLQDGQVSTLWSSDDPLQTAVAPFALPDGGSALVMQLPGPETGETPDVAARLIRLAANGKPQGEVPLPFKVHQWLRVVDERLVGVSLGFGDGRPQIFTVDLASGGVEELSFANELYLALQREPVENGRRALAPWVNRHTGRWQIGLVSVEGRPEAGLVKNEVDNFAPTWRPGGGEFAFLAGVVPDYR